MSTWLSGCDAGWLHMEEPCNLMMITALLEFPALLPRHRLERTLHNRLLIYDRFRMRVEDSGGHPRWLPVEVDLDYHLCYERLEGASQLLDRVGQLMAQPLNRDFPLWQFHVLEFEGRCALVPRLHHAMGDGVGLMRVLLGMADEPAPEPLRPQAKPPRLGAWYRAILRLLSLALARPDPATPLKGPLGVEKKVARSKAYSLGELKERARALNITLNDLLMSALTAALRSYIEQRGYPAAGLQLRAVVPVDMRRAGEEELGNRFGLVFLTLPVGNPESLQRMTQLKIQLDELKISPEAAAVYALIRLAGMLPARIEHWIVSLFSSKATLVATNLPGPRQPSSLAGVPLERMVYWVPMSGRLGLGISFLSYADRLEMGVAGDAGLLPDPERIVALFEQAYQALL